MSLQQFYFNMTHCEGHSVIPVAVRMRREWRESFAQPVWKKVTGRKHQLSSKTNRSTNIEAKSG